MAPRLQSGWNLDLDRKHNTSRYDGFHRIEHKNNKHDSTFRSNDQLGSFSGINQTISERPLISTKSTASVHAILLVLLLLAIAIFFAYYFYVKKRNGHNGMFSTNNNNNNDSNADTMLINEAFDYANEEDEDTTYEWVHEA